MSPLSTQCLAHVEVVLEAEQFQEPIIKKQDVRELQPTGQGSITQKSCTGRAENLAKFRNERFVNLNFGKLMQISGKKLPIAQVDSRYLKVAQKGFESKVRENQAINDFDRRHLTDDQLRGIALAQRSYHSLKINTADYYDEIKQNIYVKKLKEKESEAQHLSMSKFNAIIDQEMNPFNTKSSVKSVFSRHIYQIKKERIFWENQLNDVDSKMYIQEEKLDKYKGMLEEEKMILNSMHPSSLKAESRERLHILENYISSTIRNINFYKSHKKAIYAQQKAQERLLTCVEERLPTLDWSELGLTEWPELFAKHIRPDDTDELGRHIFSHIKLINLRGNPKLVELSGKKMDFYCRSETSTWGRTLKKLTQLPAVKKVLW